MPPQFGSLRKWPTVPADSDRLALGARGAWAEPSVLVRGEPQNHPPELLRSRLHVFQVERIPLRFVDRRLPLAPIGQELARLQSVMVAAGFVASDVPPELDELHPVLADQRSV